MCRKGYCEGNGSAIPLSDFVLGLANLDPEEFRQKLNHHHVHLKDSTALYAM